MTKIGELLVKNRRITQEQLRMGVETKNLNPNDRLGSILKHYGFIDDHALAETLSEQIGWKLYTDKYSPDDRVINEVGVDFLTKHQIYPLKNGVTPTFVLSYVDNVDITDVLKKEFGYSDINFYIGMEKEVRDALDSVVNDRNKKNIHAQIEKVKQYSVDSLVEWLEDTICRAIISRASDIHIEPTPKATEIRFRIDGVLYSIDCLNPEYIRAIANIILTKCNTNPGEYGNQDGSFEYENKTIGRKFDIRFSQIPTIYGPGIVLRLLDKCKSSTPLEKLGYSDHNWKLISQAIKAPHGIILVTGPTGSGKSTTLAAVLNHIKSIDKKILTVEDPVEMTHSLMTQVEISKGKSITFGNTVRSFLRQDPDIILIGEIRDQETAIEAMRASITGHQIFSTLHANDPVSAILRLKDLGVEPANISNCLLAVISQRLVRRLCPLCSKKVTVHQSRCAENEKKYFKREYQTITVSEGCSHCRGGYYDRTVVAEVLVIDPEIKDLIGNDRMGEISAVLRKRIEYRTMVEDMKELVLNGQTTLEEATRILG